MRSVLQLSLFALELLAWLGKSDEGLASFGRLNSNGFVEVGSLMAQGICSKIALCLKMDPFQSLTVNKRKVSA